MPSLPKPCQHDTPAGFGAATPDAPRGNLTGDPYFTDGLRAVLFLSEERTPLERLRYIEWEEPVVPER